MRHHRLISALLIAAALFAFGDGGAVAGGDEAPFNVIAFANAPGWITITWEHSGADVYGFVLEQESPFAFMQLDPGKRIFTATGLEANHDYRFRVCAVYDFNRICSDYASARTMPPPPPPPSATPATPPPAAPKPLPKPALTATPHTWRQIWLRWDFPGYDVLLTNAKLYREGRFIYEALAPGNFASGYLDLVPRPNTEYSYKLCFTNPAEEQCSDEIKATGTPITPSPPSGVTAAVVRRSSGVIGSLGMPQLEVRWRNGETPGQFITVERQEANSRPSGTDLRGSVFGTLRRQWIEVTRLPARTDPTETVVELPEAGGLRTVDTKTYRVCTVVPKLGDAGKVCSEPVTLP